MTGFASKFQFEPRLLSIASQEVTMSYFGRASAEILQAGCVTHYEVFHLRNVLAGEALVLVYEVYVGSTAISQLEKIWNDRKANHLVEATLVA